MKNHPRYAEDFDYYMPAAVKTGDEAMRNEWLLQQAAIWPDMARGLPEELKARYNHPTWHYIDIPSFLSDDDRAAIEPHLTINMSLDAPAKSGPDMNAVQTIRLARSLLKSGSIGSEEAAVWLCWLLHAVGDLHQPLHATAMFSTPLFPEGDKGGNSILTQQGFSLHALWDESSAIGRSLPRPATAPSNCSATSKSSKALTDWRLISTKTPGSAKAANSRKRPSTLPKFLPICESMLSVLMTDRSHL